MKNMAYVFLGDELGARPTDPRCYVDRRVSYHRLEATPSFARGIGRLEQGSASQRIAILCAEGEPLDCHRTVLVARVLSGRSHSINHIHRSGDLETYQESMTRLRAQWGLLEADLLHDDDELQSEALARQEAKIAYVADDAWAERIGIT